MSGLGRWGNKGRWPVRGRLASPFPERPAYTLHCSLTRQSHPEHLPAAISCAVLINPSAHASVAPAPTCARTPSTVAHPFAPLPPTRDFHSPLSSTHPFGGFHAPWDLLYHVAHACSGTCARQHCPTPHHPHTTHTHAPMRHAHARICTHTCTHTHIHTTIMRTQVKGDDMTVPYDDFKLVIDPK